METTDKNNITTNNNQSNDNIQNTNPIQNNNNANTNIPKPQKKKPRKKINLYADNIDYYDSDDDKISEEKPLIPKEYAEATSKIGHHVDTCCKNDQGREYEENDRVVTCWKCGTLNLVNKFWEMIECNACHALCEIPNLKKKKNIYTNNIISEAKSQGMVAPRYTAIVCPFCKFETKVDLRAKEMMCQACNHIYTIIRPDKNPPEKFCDSVNPHSYYYKFQKRFKKVPQYPPNNSIAINDMYFPDPVLYHEGAPYPVNPFADYVWPYQEALSFKRGVKKMELNNKIKNDIMGKFHVDECDKKKFYKMTDDLIKKIDNSIKNNNYMCYVSGDNEDDKKIVTPDIKNKNKKNNLDIVLEDNKKINRSTDRFIHNRSKEKSKLIESMFLMK